MAGRGVDILLGGSPQDKSEAQKVRDLGGLYVLGTERHESRRIDNQLRGRSGRQGDPGESQFFISMEDDLMRIFGGDRLKNMMERLGLPEDQPIEHSFISKSIESAQRRVEGHNFDIRKHLVEYDDVMNRQREVYYKKRKKILELDIEKDGSLDEEIKGKLGEEEIADFEKNTKSYDQKVVRDVERRIYLSVMDQLWVEHLNTMDQLRDSIGLRGYGQVDPLIAYKEESLRLFEGLLREIDDTAIDMLLKIKIEPAAEKPVQRLANPLEYHGADTAAGSEVIEETKNSEETAVAKATENKPVQAQSDVKITVRNASKKMNQAVEQGAQSSATKSNIGRNDPCSCGSGKKYKKCCGK
jgi:preprotein translocase subunit SecA